MSIENVICTKEEQLKENLEKIKSDMAYPAMTENELKKNIDYVSETFDEQEEVRLYVFYDNVIATDLKAIGIIFDNMTKEKLLNIIKEFESIKFLNLDYDWEIDNDAIVLSGDCNEDYKQFLLQQFNAKDRAEILKKYGVAI